MGSLIYLGLGRLEIDWAKNCLGREHGSLFQPSDLGKATYYYTHDEREIKEAYVRPLKKVVPRLELLGYTLEACEATFNNAVSPTNRRLYGDLLEEDPFDYGAFADALARVDVWCLKAPDDDDYDLGEFLARSILGDEEFGRLLPEAKNLTRYTCQSLEQLDPYVILRLLAENPSNANRMVSWRFADVFEGGWIEREELLIGAREHERFLVVTEGSSDSQVLARSLEIVKPEVADFFEFIDMREGYPFTGAGNVARFCEGLAKIRILTPVLIVLDNDTAGHEALRQIQAIDLPASMSVITLPDLENNEFRTIGPSGTSLDPVNGSACSIEMFLDLSYGRSKTPLVRWTSFNKKMDRYQGELVDKTSFVSDFLKKGCDDPKYDFTKLEALWNYLISACISLRQGRVERLVA